MRMIKKLELTKFAEKLMIFSFFYSSLVFYDVIIYVLL
jgi:hypothetical protein